MPGTGQPCPACPVPGMRCPVPVTNSHVRHGHPPSSYLWTRELTSAEQLLFQMPEGKDERLALAVAAAREGKEAGPVAYWQVLGTLANQECPVEPAQVNAAVERSFAVVKASEPGNGYSELAELLARCPRALGAPELDRLEAAVSRPQFEYPRAQAFDELLQLARGIAPAPARPAAVSAWLALDQGAFLSNDRGN